jgi:hypothetical protein
MRLLLLLLFYGIGLHAHTISIQVNYLGSQTFENGNYKLSYSLRELAVKFINCLIINSKQITSHDHQK